jgi:hypothetical protein
MGQVTAFFHDRLTLGCRRIVSGISAVTWLALMIGCGTTRMSDTQRTATEQLLISNAVDQAVSQIDFRFLAAKPVYFDPQYLDGTVDKGYVISSLRQQLLASGCVLKEDRSKAVYVVEARAGAVGTDRHSLLVGIPQMTVPTFLPGQPTQIPEIPFAKKTDEQGAAKIAVFAYNRLTGERLWQSGTIQAYSDARDAWLLGLGPFRRGSIVPGTELAGEELPNPLHLDKDTKPLPPAVGATTAACWPEKKPAGLDWRPILLALGGSTVSGPAKLTGSSLAVLASAKLSPSSGSSLSAGKGKTGTAVATGTTARP